MNLAELLTRLANGETLNAEEWRFVATALAEMDAEGRRRPVSAC